MRLRSGLLVLCGLLSSALRAHVHGGDIAADGGPDGGTEGGSSNANPNPNQNANPNPNPNLDPNPINPP